MSLNSPSLLAVYNSTKKIMIDKLAWIISFNVWTSTKRGGQPPRSVVNYSSRLYATQICVQKAFIDISHLDMLVEVVKYT